MFLSSALWADDSPVECPLKAPTKRSLIKASPYFVDDIHCIKGGKTYEWNISNKRVLSMYEPVLAKKVKKTAKRNIKRAIASEPQVAPALAKKEKLIFADNWRIGANYGAKYFSYDQSKDLGTAKIAVTMPNYYKIYSQYRFEDYEFQFDFERYKLEYESGANTGEESLNEFTLKNNYKNFVLGVAMTDSPIFKNDGGTISMSKLTLTSVIIGYKKAWKLPVEKETHLEFNPLLYYPVSIGSSNTDVKLSSPSGYRIDLGAKLSRTLKQTDKYKLRAVWPLNVRHQSLSNNVEWGSVSGKNESKIWSVGTQIGLEISF